MPIQHTSIVLNKTKGDTVWTKLKEKVADLGYTEAELIASPQLFVYIVKNNSVIKNFRNIWGAGGTQSINVPTRQSLSEVVDEVVRVNPTLYTREHWDIVNMDRCYSSSHHG